MPIWLRRFTFNILNEHYEKEEEAYKKASNQGKTVTASKPLAKPDIQDLSKIKPTYTSKMPRK